MPELIGLMQMALVGSALVLTVWWLATRRNAVARSAGVLLAFAIAAVCFFVVFALVAGEIATFDGYWPKPLGLASISVFLSTGLATLASARSRGPATPRH